MSNSLMLTQGPENSQQVPAYSAPREAIYLSPLHFAKDPKLGIDKMARVNTYMLKGVEVLTSKELMDRKRAEIQSGTSASDRLTRLATTKCKVWVSMLVEGLEYVIASTLVCLLIPLPLCGLVLYHQSYYYHSSATTDELIPEIIFLSHIFDFEYFASRVMRPHNLVVLCAAIPYYLVCIIKLCLFFLNVPMTWCIFINMKFGLGIRCFGWELR